MKYLCLICAEKVMEHMSETEAARHFKDYEKYLDEIRQSGHFVAGNRLKPVDTATTLRVRDGRVTVTDGPFAETKEQLGGYIVIEAADLDDALAVAAGIPGARIGCVEVRPVAEDEQTLALGLDAPGASAPDPD
ncbi:MAG TPA: YciI family protein [Arenicellales bacterium]|nr:YciI family protein [Arenicellales bacterium]